ncbi:hypothetical protein CCAX7_003630 [Capsulimonas corticalis]|uniref:Uncharacterized protein n=1 Tax=Capsulimonas corticalis TaxID=2219043 RepID=A0A402CSA6_9BACT|nr:hypothetical protein [Capsulimonas corticalis]BDI28312.1 hypothetical protein CCAX7_003630 [Capsulimonas corticalis]
MKRLKLHWSARPLSWLLSVAMLMPLMVLLLAAAPRAEAQASASRSGQPAWAVLDFTNRSGYGGNDVGRQASDSFVVELGKSNKYDVSPRQDTLAGLENLGLTLPLDKIGMQKLGRDRNVDAVVSGEILTVAFDNKPRRATVSVVVRVVDTVSGELVNGAVAQGVSTPRPVGAGDDDSLVNQAIDNATFTAVRQITSFNLPKATVLNNVDTTTVLINKGSRDGVYDGLKLLVTRAGSEVGRIRVTSVEPDQSTAEVTDRGLGIQPQDRATAIYELPSYSVRADRLVSDNSTASTASTPSGKRNSFSGIGGILVAILVGALLLSLVKGGSSTGSGGGAHLGSVKAVLVRASDAGVFGQAPVGLATANTTYVPVAIHITANRGNIDASLFQEYHIYRPDWTNLATTIFAGGTTGATVPLGFGPVPIDAVADASPLNYYDDGRLKTYTASKPATSGGIDLRTFTCGIPTATDPQCTSAGIPTALVGVSFRYSVEGLWDQTITTTAPTGATTGGTTGTTGSTGTTTGTTTATHFYLTPQQTTNSVTYLQPPVLIQDGTNFTGTAPNRVFVTLNSTYGASDYILEISTSATFGSKKTYRPYNPGAINIFSGSQVSPQSGLPFSFFNPSTGLNLQTEFPGAAQLFYRVGVRDGRNGTDSDTNPYLYTDPVAVPQSLVTG